ncbi:hypothetical protein MSL71_22040 [Desulfoluna butyratoxydans]|uniref:Uncharacterized protein n=1 Tax=Desulfoluna butyratoxydans TaxID=231438 RepID=A0A4U8YKX0_9BACT|nr:hypothetical protein MSL71_22040 [Desulfoluna butyratoxydans]
MNEASGGPAGGQTFEKFDKQLLKKDSVRAKSKANVTFPVKRRGKHIRNQLFSLPGSAWECPTAYLDTSRSASLKYDWAVFSVKVGTLSWS